MNYLELCRELRSEAGFSGEGLPLTVDGQTGELGRVVRWIRNAATVMQAEHADWTFMRESFAFQTEAGKAKYTPADLAVFGIENVDHWLKDSFQISQDGGPVGSLRPMHMQMFVRRFRNPRQARPTYWSMGIDRGLVLGETPDGVYDITGEFQRTPVTLTLDADVPPIPEQFHEGIVWKALAYYGTHEEAPSFVERGEAEYRRVLAKMRTHYLPDIRMMGQPL